jgi:hypothetical protein
LYFKPTVVTSFSSCYKRDLPSEVKQSLMRFEVLRTVKLSFLVFWVVTLIENVDRYKRFDGT